MADVPDDWETLADRYAAEAVADGRPTAWFDRLYRAGTEHVVPMPWNRDTPHPLAAAWLQRHSELTGRAVVVGCGLGADAEFLAAAGFDTTAFDVSPTAIAAARERYPNTTVHYEAADLFDLPETWRGAFDLVLEIHTVQALPREVRIKAIAAVCSLVAPGGTALVIAFRGRGSEPGPPWPLSQRDIESFVQHLELVDLDSQTTPDSSTRRWVAELRSQRGPTEPVAQNASG